MRRMMNLAAILSFTLTCTAKDKSTLEVRAVSHESQVFQRTSTYTTPGTSNTTCSGSATTIGNTTNGTADCRTQSTPAQTHQVTANIVDVTNIVEANGSRYIITCRAGWVGSHCGPMIDGDLFPAEIEGTTMWIEARKGGNQGKKIKVKYKILDIRPVANPVLVDAQASLDPSRNQNHHTDMGDPLDNAAIVQMVKVRLREDVIVYLIDLRPAKYLLSQKDRTDLRASGVTDSIIRAMAEKMGVQ
jgi:hypothetical protein